MNKESMFRIGSFNIRYQNEDDIGLTSWVVRKNKVLELIRFHDIDIIGLQEVLKDQLIFLKNGLKGYDYVGVGREDGEEEGEFGPIFFKKDKFILEDWGVFWLSETPEVKGSMGWDAACIRIVTWAKFKVIKTGDSFYFFNTHLDHVGKEAMEQGTYLLLDNIKNIANKFPVLLTGDFNNTPNSEVYKILTRKSENFVKDSRYMSINEHYGCDFSFHNFKILEIFENIQKGLISDFPLIDYIFIKNNVKVINHAILPDNWNGVYPSDHMPVIIDIEL
ncbi:endonuclease/exonuclease/phosphatase family protein [Oceanotoga sp. DSM 15011]|uniref:Endonuclease/exonuclease/phosphatase family metal-dependent hydrolase n=1 Tax=Oceanotoga teriensis TaxID=515440 RepID=A0AA45C6V7_9BACT|nr:MULTISPECIES: endonuclease/exonuclease/phosphatase family protein [Oceanotoga]MDO7977244.1 endonuclease/exonuclease/phosphatase family protein [Oceanotoga teriensis]PWJ93234.1 endonuclease/exonuclease/phosphatase family metal-dependent hydrolase [Oceanotoga teriensis]UYP01233.1 endonuclease/exonuclease/phosphatase family protein [Oceanotoga sp. DSM 15011]